MKSIIVALSMVATTAFAGGSFVSYPKYDGVSVNNLCDAGSTFKTIKPVQVCDKWVEIPGNNGGELYTPSDWKCVAAHTEQVTVSKTGTECVKYGSNDITAADCLQYAPVARPNTVIAEKITDMGEAQAVENFYYTIGACSALNPKPVQ